MAAATGMVRMPDLSWRDAIIEVLKNAEAPMHYGAIADAITRQGFRTECGPNTAQIVASTISVSIREEYEESPFIRVSSGYYALREYAARTTDSGDAQRHEHVRDKKLIECCEMTYVAMALQALGLKTVGDLLALEESELAERLSPGGQVVYDGAMELHRRLGKEYERRSTEEDVISKGTQDASLAPPEEHHEVKPAADASRDSPGWQGELIENRPLFPDAGTHEEIRDVDKPAPHPEMGLESGIRDLPEAAHYDQMAADDGDAALDEQEASTDEIDEEDRHLLEVLTGAPDSSAEPAGERGTVGVPSPGDSAQSGDFLARLRSRLEQNLDCRTERIPSGLKLELLYRPGLLGASPAKGGALRAGIDYNARQGVLRISALLPYREGAESRLLRLVGANGFACSIGIHDFVGEQCFVVRRTVDTRAYSEEEIVNAVEEALLDAIRANSLVGEP